MKIKVYPIRGRAFWHEPVDGTTLRNAVKSVSTQLKMLQLNQALTIWINDEQVYATEKNAECILTSHDEVVFIWRDLEEKI